MVGFPHAKINLGLQVIEKRHDGFHNIISCLYPIGWCDVLEVLPASALSFNSSGLEIPGDPQQNLCIKAYQLLKESHDIPAVQIHLHKIIPMGAGLGGGSSDAALMLKMLVELFDLKVSLPELQAYAASLGSDCPFFLEDQPQMVQGRGEILSQLPLKWPLGYLLVVCPDISVNTAQAYAGLQPIAPQYDLQELLKSGNLQLWRENLSNDFEPTVFEKFPAIKELKETFYELGADYASMSGSGASVFGFFKLRPDTDKIPAHYHQWLQKV